MKKPLFKTVMMTAVASFIGAAMVLSSLPFTTPASRSTPSAISIPRENGAWTGREEKSI